MYLTNDQQICNFKCVLLTDFVPLPQVLYGIRQDVFLWKAMPDWKLYIKTGRKLFLWILSTISGLWYQCPLSRKATKLLKVIKTLSLWIPEFFPSQWRNKQAYRTKIEPSMWTFKNFPSNTAKPGMILRLSFHYLGEGWGEEESFLL